MKKNITQQIDQLEKDLSLYFKNVSGSDLNYSKFLRLIELNKTMKSRIYQKEKAIKTLSLN